MKLTLLWRNLAIIKSYMKVFRIFLDLMRFLEIKFYFSHFDLEAHGCVKSCVNVNVNVGDSISFCVISIVFTLGLVFAEIEAALTSMDVASVVVVVVERRT